ncbi:hypothetical protein DL546_006266 [Coniochaeta pulveracea]|uniref:Uncharacterized protein n=1 Tax=Coniochaeta pulveracea TaxID=177199 RepID=A0A420YHJ8_9PEZI|nr:hypothetical protein DL546_006266 [Coniochaeta pulveracea]
MDRPALPVTGLDLSSQPTTTNNSPQPAGVEEKIPRMTNIAPSIFVPLEIDITQPIEPARDRAEKLQRILAAAEGRRKGVTENIIYMTEREMARIRQEGRTYEAIHGPPAGPRPSMTEKEVDDMMANIAADAPPGKSLARVNLADIEIKFPEQMSQREAVAAELLNAVEQSTQNLEGYSALMETRKAELLQMQQREQARLDNIGKRPEEREVARDDDVEMS